MCHITSYSFQEGEMIQQNFNANWRFCKDEGKFDDITLPHDAMLEEDRIPDLIAGENNDVFFGMEPGILANWWWYSAPKK